jgi:aminopeptidase
VAKQARVFGAAARPFMEARSNLRNIWSVAAAAGPTWARRVFPGLDETDATEQLWDAILTVNRVDEPDPILAWEQHVLELERRSAYLNDKRYDRLLYRGPGTDLTLGLPRGHVWKGGSAGERRSIPNIPTEEVFTAPDRMRVDGVVRATKPLSYSGSLIDDFELHFEAGVVTASRAGVGQDVLDRLLTFDQGSVRLGEAALVPQSSLVSQQNLVWRNTLFDENDGCHIALGMAYAVCLDGGPEMNADERTAAGLNQSDTHVDCVIGSPELDIYGITEDGSEEPLLLGGEWAFDA